MRNNLFVIEERMMADLRDVSEHANTPEISARMLMGLIMELERLHDVASKIRTVMKYRLGTLITVALALTTLWVVFADLLIFKILVITGGGITATSLIDHFAVFRRFSKFTVELRRFIGQINEAIAQKTR